MTLMI